MSRRNLATCDWYEMKESLGRALTGTTGSDKGVLFGMALFEQIAWKSYDSGRCHQCGEPGTVKVTGSNYCQAVPFYVLCDACDSYGEGSIGGNAYTVLTRDGEHWTHVASLNNKRNAQRIARELDGETTVRVNGY